VLSCKSGKVFEIKKRGASAFTQVIGPIAFDFLKNFLPITQSVE
jgi:hypothetical protein